MSAEAQPALTLRTLKLGILRVLAQPGTPDHSHKSSVIGLPYSRGHLEALLDVTFQDDDRERASQAFEELKKTGLIRRTYGDPNAPELNVRITERGLAAIENELLDDLDRALDRLAPRLLELREGAWSRLNAGGPDAARQAAHSGRELATQVLKLGAPDDVVRRSPGFENDPTAPGGISRRDRARTLGWANLGPPESDDQELRESACSSLVAAHDRLIAISHYRKPLHIESARNALRSAEDALRALLVVNPPAA